MAEINKITKGIIITIVSFVAGAGAVSVVDFTQDTALIAPTDLSIVSETLTLQEEGIVCSMIDQVEECINIPEKKDITVDVNYLGEQGSITVNFDGYNRCRNNNKTKSECLEKLHDQIEKNIQWWKEGQETKLQEEQIQDFSEELNEKDF